MSMRLILVGVDGSEGAEAALRWVAQLARDLDAEVLAVHAFEPPAALTGSSRFAMLSPDVVVETTASLRSEAREALEDAWTEPLREAGVRYRTELVDGGPTWSLMDTAQREGADLIAVGTRGRGGFAELVLGSVSHHLTHHARIPVAVVPPGR